MKPFPIPLLPACLLVPLFLWFPHASAHEGDVEGEVRAGHSHEGEAFNEGPRQFATRIAGCGDVHFPIRSSWPEAQEWFDQGIGQLHGFWYFEAERTFRHIAAQDPKCAMAYWGMAMANWENPKRAAGFIAKAVEHREQANDAGKLWIDAQHAFLTAPGKNAIPKRRQLIRDLEAIIHAFPEDIEAKAFLACRIWQFSRLGIPIGSHEAVDAMLRQVVAKAPLHPAHHYIIHLWDEEKAARALDSADILAETAPAIAHMWHMPGHIYSKLHRYEESAWCQMASSRVDHRQMLEHRVMPDQIHNYVHNQEWLIRNHHLLGNARDALAVAEGLLANPRHPVLNTPSLRRSSIHFGRMRLLETLEFFELWDEALALSATDFPDEGLSDDVRLKRLRLLGIARFEKSNAAALGETIAGLASEVVTVEAEKTAAEEQARAKAKKEKKDGKSTRQAVSTAGQPFADKLRRLGDVHAELDAHAALLEGRTGIEFGALRRPKHVIARLRQRAGDSADALSLSKEAVDAAPNQVLPLAARVEILHRESDSSAAREVFTELKSLSAHIDLSAPPFRRLAEIAAEFGEPDDWRVPAITRSDLNALGPRDWTPPPAPAFSLPDASGTRVGLEHYRGKPVVVLFYLGHGCLHCIEQLNAFAPKRASFLEAGIEMVAVSCDTVEDLAKSQKAYAEDGLFPFPILADPASGVFKSYRAFDDFENKPLHGTFLIDASGRVLWQDIGAEPFGDPEFLLAEARRLLESHHP